MAKTTAAYLIVLTLAACSRSEPQAAADTRKQVAPASSPPTAKAPEPAPSPGASVSAGGLTWSAQAPLEARPPKSKMRAAEYGLSTDPEAELSVFYFGAGQGGAVDANISRWLGQLSQTDGSDTAKTAKRSERKVGEVSVTLIEATGTYSGGMALPGAPTPAPQPDAMLLGAIASGPEGPVFFKLVGKRASVEGARAAFDALIDSLRPAS